MYSRIKESELINIQERFFKDGLFCTISEILDRFCLEDDDLNAVEIWSEALNVMTKLSQSERPELLISGIRGQLIRKFSAFQNHDGTTDKRSKEQAHITTDKVLICVLYMLCACDDWNQHSALVLKIGSFIAGNPLFPQFFKRQRIAEAAEEKAGRSISAVDYLASIVEQEDETLKGGFSTRVSLPPDLVTSFSDLAKLEEFYRIIQFKIFPFIKSPEGNEQLWEVVRNVAIEKAYIASRCPRKRFARVIELICPEAGSASKIQANMEKYCKKGIDLENDLASIRSRFIPRSR